MALIRCPECGRAAVETASTCMHCGHALQDTTLRERPRPAPAGPPTTSESSDNAWAYILIAGVILLTLFLKGAGDPPPVRDRAATSRPVPTSMVSELPPASPATTAPPKEDPLPQTGTELMPRGTRGYSEITVINGLERHAVVRLLDASRVPRRIAFIRAGDRYKINGIGSGRFFLQYTTGRQWSSPDRRFVDTRGYHEFVDPIRFDEFEKGREIYYDVLEITLHPVVGGNARTRVIDEEDFYAPVTSPVFQSGSN